MDDDKIKELLLNCREEIESFYFAKDAGKSNIILEALIMLVRVKLEEEK